MEDLHRETINIWNKVAQLYEDRFMDFHLYDDTYDLFINLLKKSNSKILDVGCGPGNITRYLLSKNSGLEVSGIDAAENMVLLAKKNNPEASFDKMDIRKISRILNKYDGIICGFCLPYLSSEDRVRLFVDCYDLINDKGVFYLSFVEGNYEDSDYRKGSSGDTLYFYYHTVENVLKELNKSGFNILHLVKKNYESSDGKMETHCVVVAEKVK